MPTTDTDRLPDAHGIAIGDRVQGRCVSLGCYYTGTVAAICPPLIYSGQYGNRYRLVDTGESYSTGGAIEPTVECVERIGA